jgi:hypothetical protein
VLQRLGAGVVSLAACVLAFGVVAATGCQQKEVQLTIVVRGKGSVSVGGHRVSCVPTSCRKTLAIRPGTTKLTARAAPTWKFIAWSRACHPKTETTCALSVRRSTRVAATFAPPGARANPISLGQEANVRENWLMKVVSVRPDADDLVLRTSNNRADAQVPAGKKDFLVQLSVMFLGAGRGDLGELIGYAETVGPHGTLYDNIANGCPGTWPSPSFQGVAHRKQTVIPSTWHTGNACYLVASADAARMRMFVYPIYPPSTEYSRTMWFALG